MSDTYDLLNPESLSANYVRQLRQTIDAYLPQYVFIGEVLQNALDAVREAPKGKHRIDIGVDFDTLQVSIKDNAVGFPNDPKLLFLGGGKKDGKKLAGQVGVGLKVVLFSSEQFTIRSRTTDGSFKFSVENACDFDQAPDARPSFTMPKSFDPDPDPLETVGTEITYRFRSDSKVPANYLQEVLEEALPRGVRSDFTQTLKNAKESGNFPTRFAALFACDLKRFSYLGMTQVPDALKDTTVSITVKCSNPNGTLARPLGELFDNETEFSFQAPAGYLTMADTVSWASPPKPALYSQNLGAGGVDLRKVQNGFNVTEYRSQDDFEALLTNARGKLPEDIETFRKALFPKINHVRLTVARIPHFERYLPGGSQRVFSANGVVTRHSADLTKGRNQQYVRCFDIVVDVDAELNYGKYHLKNMRLVGMLKGFVNEAYRSTIQNAAARFVGKADPFEEEERSVAFWSRKDLMRPELTIRKVPADENDVIALFFELAGKGKFPEFSWYGLSQRDKYDARAVIQREGDDADILKNPVETNLRVVEFKIRAGSITQDFDREDKNAGDIHLLIAYEEGVSKSDQFQFIDLQDSDTVHRAPERIFPHVTRVLKDTRTGFEVQVLILRDCLEKFFPPPPAPAAPEDAIDE
ncbi:ATP-binding protein [Streptomyces californicus]|uniref:ATP-binding protein n=1 Tax=Streptomyces californicus TaxID=67351 RepID=UPI0033EB1D61